MGKLLLSILFIFGSLSLWAQKSMNFQYLHTIPIGEFQDNLMHRPSGIAFEYMMSPLKDKKLQIGASVSVSMYQNEDHTGEIAISSTENAYVETNEDDCFYTYQGVARYYFTEEQKFIRPYVQGLVGGATFFSSLSFTENPENAFDAETRTHGSTLLTGVGGGLAFRIFDGAYMDASLTYNASGQTTYRASPESDSSIQYRVDLGSHQNTSRVNHLALKIGLNMLF